MARPLRFAASTYPSRRQFLGRAGAGAALALAAGSLRAAPASERVRIGVIGLGGQGRSHVRALASLPAAEVAYVCDIDAARVDQARREAPDARGVADFRRVLDDAAVDAVTIATPDHWHAPAALLALQAGKHVYVEKPSAHNFRESQLLVEAVESTGLKFQHGTQTRSSAGMRRVVELLREGLIGDVLIAKCWNWQRRDNIGHRQPSDPPSGVDYDLWVGPAEWLPFQANRFHYDWHWWFNFGSGGMGNDGVHELDYALWGLGVSGLPSSVAGSGGVYYFDDDREWPDTQQVTLEYQTDDAAGGPRMLIYEQRLWSTTYPFNVDSGAEFYGKQGKLFVSKRGKLEVRDDRNQRVEVEIEAPVSGSVDDHLQDWIDCIRDDKTPHAPVQIAHQTNAAIHLGNLATRLRRTLHVDPQAGTVAHDEVAQGMLRRTYRDGGHWAIPPNV